MQHLIVCANRAVWILQYLNYDCFKQFESVKGFIFRLKCESTWNEWCMQTQILEKFPNKFFLSFIVWYGQNEIKVKSVGNENRSEA